MLAELIRQAGILPEEEVEAFVGLWKKHVLLRRNQHLIFPGEEEKHLYFVLDGTLRLYFPTETEEICVGFAYPNTLVCSIPSFLSDKPSDYGIAALRQCELMGVSKADFNSFLLTSPTFERYWRLEIEKALLGRIDREIDLLLADPAQRLQRLLARSPHIFQLVPLKYIASYLRMTPETLSRLRARS